MPHQIWQTPVLATDKGKMMKLIKLITATILASSAIAITPTQAWPQAGVGYVPGYWQPEVKAENPREPIVLKLVNESGLPVTYNLDPGPERFLPVGNTTTLIVDLNSQADNYATVNIYNSDILGYEYNAEGNVITVRITRGYPDKDHKAVYITETGRVYSF